jgi:hypothetical protein
MPKHKRRPIASAISFLTVATGDCGAARNPLNSKYFEALLPLVSQATLRGTLPTAVSCNADVDVGRHYYCAAARRLPRLRDWSRVRVMKAAICSRGTGCEGL